MILALPKISQEQYDSVKSDFYKKPNIPEIELKLESLQQEILLRENYDALPEFRENLSIYAKSILLKQLKGSTDFIDPETTEILADTAADNFIKRYFRLENPTVGASFAGILIFKVKEVLSIFFKGLGIESNVSIDSYYGGEEGSNNALTVEQKLSFDMYEKNQGNEIDVDILKEDGFNKIERECELLAELDSKSDVKLNLNTKFLQYLIYLLCIQQKRKDKRLTTASAQALRVLEENETQREKIAPYLESALLDIQR